MIRYFALACIFFQVATTAALATQVVLFAEAEPSFLPSGNPAQLAGSGADDTTVMPSSTRDNIDRYPRVSTLYVEVPATIAPSP